MPKLRPRKRWERKLPAKYMLGATEPGERALYVKVEIEAIDTAETRRIRALVDSGATGDETRSHLASYNNIFDRKR
jgi:hypothetical protein